MEVILLENIKNLGNIGDIVNVRRGHGRNFLIKYGKALKASKKYKAVILDKTDKSCVIQITALRREIDLIVKNLKKYGLVSVSRTGAVAMTRGSEIFK